MAAQPQNLPGQTMNINQAVLPEFDQEMANTRKSLERIPDDHLNFKPHPKSSSLGELATHLGTLNQWADVILNGSSFDISNAPKPASIQSRAELLAAFDQCTANARKVLAAAPDGELMKPWSLLKGGENIFTLPRIAVFRSFILSHCIHHRAQLGVYLRMNDVPVPSIYGPSADEDIG